MFIFLLTRYRIDNQNDKHRLFSKVKPLPLNFSKKKISLRKLLLVVDGPVRNALTHRA
jgi:hypothetical protein